MVSSFHKRKITVSLILLLSLSILSCSSHVPSINGKTTQTTPPNTVAQTSTAQLTLAQTPAEPLSTPTKTDPNVAIGSTASNWTEDRQVWTIFEKEVGFNANVTATMIHLPRILLATEDAKKANAKIDELQDQLKEYYKNTLEFVAEDTQTPEDSASYLLYNSPQASYRVFQNSELLSILIEYQGGGRLNTGFLCFTFDLKDGKRLGVADLAKKYGIKANEIERILEWNVLRFAKDYGKFFGAAEEWSYQSLTGYSMQEFWENYDADGNDLYVDETGQLTYIFIFYTPAGSGSYASRTPITLPVDVNYAEVNPIFARFASYRGDDPYDPKVDAYIFDLGGIMQTDDITPLMQRLNQFIYNFDPTFTDPSFLGVMRNDGFDYRLDAVGYYLIVPRLRSTTIYLEAQAMDDTGKITPLPNQPYGASTGLTVIGINQHDLYTNAAVHIQSRDKNLNLDMTRSGMDGSIAYPASIIDASSDLDQLENPYGMSSYFLEEYLKSQYEGD